ncbi:MAG: tRNA epoxyqueuosine(34) reductase QueG [Coprobacter sp.]|nr:tRNA epoxyqueuosine(34) reductase QueG [Coprobacter sp.]
MDTGSKRFDLTAAVKEKALSLGFTACGVAEAAPVAPADRERLSVWLENGCQDGMRYLSNHFEKRCDPRLLVEGARSVVSVALNYYPSVFLPAEHPQFAFYAYGRDYHLVVMERLSRLADFIRSLCPDAVCRCFCDTGPVLEKYWAWKAGLGFIGRHTQLIVPGQGSYFFLGEVVTSVPLCYDAPLASQCGDCRACIECCPVSALSADGPRLDARRCLSCQTIENRDGIAPEIAAHLGNRVYGCDTCQRVCPCNRTAAPSRVREFVPSEALLSLSYDRLKALSREEYDCIFRHSAVKRAKYEGLMRNVGLLPDKKL